MSNACRVHGCEGLLEARSLCKTHYRRWQRHGDPNVTLRTVHKGTPSERFWKRVEKSTACWVWQGRVARNGYGIFSIRKKTHVAHRFAYLDTVGPIPSGIQLDHLCHNRRCVHPAHLRFATNKQNNENPAGLRADNTSGFRGVVFNKRSGRWYAKAQHQGRTHSAGGHATPEEAAEAARQLRLSLFTHNDADRAHKKGRT